MKRTICCLGMGVALVLSLAGYAEAGVSDSKGVIAIIIFGSPLPLLVIGYTVYYILKRRYEQTIFTAAIEKGLPVPDMPKPSPSDPRKAALILSALGVGYFIATVVTVSFITKPDAPSPLQVGIWGIIPVLIGMALWYYDRMIRKETQAKLDR